jgi:hypothetical protein
MTSKLSELGALERLGKQFELLELEGAASRRPSYRRLAIAAAVVLALAAASLTPPGRAVAERIGEIVGIGDEPTGVGGDSVVIGVGESPSGARYEIFASTKFGPGIPAEDYTCIGLNVPAPNPAIKGASCLTEDLKHQFERDVISPIAAPAPKGLGQATIVQGLARGDVANVEMAHHSPRGALTRIPVQFFPLTEALGTQIGSEESAGFFVAFVPDELLFAGDERDGPAGEYANEVFSRLGIRVIGDDGATLIDERYTDLRLPRWWSMVALGPRGGAGFPAIPVEPPSAIRKAPKAAN